MKLSAPKVLQKGFTLIELLVVIGILGILAAALIATIDPFEQLNKAADARTENTLVEFQNGLLRYYTLKGVMPWDSVDGDDCMAGLGGAPDGDSLTVMEDCVTALIDQGELKQSFSTSPDLQNIYVTEETTNNAVLCYAPISKAKRRSDNTLYDNVGAPVSNPKTECEGYGGATVCYWCSR